jgi:hypothetical protein
VTTRARESLDLKLPSQRQGYSGLIASVVLHLLLIGILIHQGERLFSTALAPGLPGSGVEANTQSGGGGSRVAYITLPSIPEPEARPVPKRPTPAPVPKPVVTPPREPEKTVLPAPEPADTAVALAAQEARDSGGSAPAAGTGGGTEGTAGTGAGPEASGGEGTGPGGEGGKARPPIPRDMAFPFDTPPKELRGLSLSVTFWVRVDGRVERYTVEPRITDRDYAKKFDEVMRAFRFTPAQTADGTRIPGTTRIFFTLPGKSSS